MTPTLLPAACHAAVADVVAKGVVVRAVDDAAVVVDGLRWRVLLN